MNPPPAVVERPPQPAPPAEGGEGLRRQLGLFPLTNIVIANMVGAGIFTTSGLLMKDLGRPLLMIGLWALGGLFALFGALAYGEIGAAIPRAGGEYAFLSRLFHPVLGFLSGWVSFFVGFSAPIAASAIGFSEYITRAFPGLLSVLPGGAGPAKKTLAVLAIAAFTFLHTRGLELGSRVQSALTVLKVVLIVGLVLAGLFSGRGDFGHLVEGAPFALDFGGWKTIGLALMWIMFAFSGWNASAYVGAEVRSPKSDLPKSLILGTGTVILLYVALNVFYVYAVPPAEMSGVISIGGLAALRLFGPNFEAALSVLIAFALFSSLSAFIILGPRVYFAMARDGVFFKGIAVVDKKTGVPARSVVLQGAIASLMVLFGTFDQLLTYMGFSLAIFPILCVLGVFKLRRRGMSVVKLPGYPITPVLYSLTATAILVLSFLERPLESSIAVLTVVAGVPVYFFFKSRNRA